MKKQLVYFLPHGSKLVLLGLCLAFFSLACLSTSAAISAVPVSTVTVSQIMLSTATNTLRGLDTPTATRPLVKCARVVAIEALHLRKGPSEKDIVLAWLKHNDIVVVVDEVHADWWHIESGVYSGYVRSIYLQESEC